MVELIFPTPFEERMKHLLKDEWQKFVVAHHQQSPVSIRIHPTKNRTHYTEPIPWTDFGFYLHARPSFTFDPLFHAGNYYVQEASSMFIEQALKQTVDLTKPIRVLDLCAAPGGKSTHLLSLINQESLLVSNETIRSRATILAENICKWGHLNCVVTNNDPEDFENLNGFFDVILVDAPCSGEGLFRKAPDALKEWSDENANLCSLRQQRILNQVWPALKTNGVLIYSTCTYNPKENQENLKPWMLSQKAESIKLKIEKNWGIQENVFDEVTGYQFFPHCVKGEGFFISILRKTEPENEKNFRTKKSFKKPPKEIVTELTSWLNDWNELDFILHHELVIALSKDHVDEIEFLSERLKVIQKGIAICTIKHNKLVPDHALALSHKINREHFPSIELNFDQSIAYLKKDSLSFPSSVKGHTLVTYQSAPLGWINHLGNRINNLYPSEWRIRSNH